MCKNDKCGSADIEKVQTPAFVFDIKALRDRMDLIMRELGARFKICYAIKANPFLVADLIDKADSFEVCSPGEYRICERNSVPPEKIVLSGVYKSRADMERIISACGAKTLYTVESPSQFELLSSIARAKNLVLSVILRLSSGNQFGMDKPTIERLITRRETSLNMIGLQLYSGTQKKTDKIEREVSDLLEWIQYLDRVHGFECRRIEYGAGLGVTYFKNEPPRDDVEALKALKRAFKGAPGNAEIVIETGRFLAADCGTYYTRIVDMKTTDGINYAITDGGINHLNYYGQMLAMKLPYISVFGSDGVTERKAESADGDGAWTVCGALCTTADVLVKNCPLPKIELGDTLVFHKTGAYTVSEGIYLFLSRDMPRIYKREASGRLRLVRDTIETDKFNG